MGDLKVFLFEYRHEGAEWALEITARDADDARARLKTLPFARLQGEVAFAASIPAPMPWLQRLFASR